VPACRCRPAALVALIAAVVPPCRPGAEPRIYDGSWNWEHPNELRLTEDEMFPRTPYERDFQSHSYYWLARLDTGTSWLMSPFQWKYGAIGTWGLYVLVRDPSGRVFSWDGKLGDGSPEVAPRGMRVARAPPVRERPGDAPWVIDVPGFSCDLTFANVLPAWKPGGGVARFDDVHYTTYSTPAPWADLSGSMTVSGVTVDAAGQCFLDASETLLPVTRTNAACQAARVWSPPGTPRGDRWFIGTLTTVSHAGYGSLRLPMLLVAQRRPVGIHHDGLRVRARRDDDADDPAVPVPARVLVRAATRGTGWRASSPSTSVLGHRHLPAPSTLFPHPRVVGS